jgi:hypothetical protein
VVRSIGEVFRPLSYPSWTFLSLAFAIRTFAEAAAAFLARSDRSLALMAAAAA